MFRLRLCINVFASVNFVTVRSKTFFLFNDLKINKEKISPKLIWIVKSCICDLIFDAAPFSSRCYSSNLREMTCIDRHSCDEKKKKDEL